VFVSKSVFLTYVLWEAMSSSPCSFLYRQNHFPFQSKVLWTKDRDEIPPKTSEYYWSDMSQLILPTAPNPLNLMKNSCMK